MPLKKEGVKSSSKKPLKKGSVKSSTKMPLKKGGGTDNPQNALALLQQQLNPRSAKMDALIKSLQKTDTRPQSMLSVIHSQQNQPPEKPQSAKNGDSLGRLIRTLKSASDLKIKYDILKYEIGKVFNENITNDIISELNIRSVDELISINPLILVLKLGKSTSKVGKENIQKLKKLIADLKIKYPRSSSSNGS